MTTTIGTTTPVAEPAQAGSATTTTTITAHGAPPSLRQNPPLSVPHAFHQNLPRPFHHRRQDEHGELREEEEEAASTATPVATTTTTVPYVTVVAHRKARKIVELAHSIRLYPEMFWDTTSDEDNGDDAGHDVSSPDAHDGADVVMEEDDDDDDVVDLDVEDGDDDDDDEEWEEGGEAGDAAGEGPDDARSAQRRGYPRRVRSRPASASHRPPAKETLQAFTKKLSRLQAQMTGLEALKYGGITQQELCEMVLHLLSLVTCTIERTNTPTSRASDSDEVKDVDRTDESKAVAAAPPSVKLHFVKVGYLWQGQDEALDDDDDESDDESATDKNLDFALHSPAREVILLILLNILSNKGPLRSVSNAAIYPSSAGAPTANRTSSHKTDDEAAGANRTLLILSWRVMMRCLLRTAPYLDEHQSGHVTADSHYRQSTVLRRTVQLIRDARHFFDQGIRPPTSDGLATPSATTTAVPLDDTAQKVWRLVEDDVLYHSHTHACYRGTILLYLFHPSRCSADYYRRMMPVWFSAWTHIDRCPEYDFLYLALFCRARKHLDATYDWGPIRRRLLTLSQYWLQLPIGGASLDKSFPRFGNPRSRSCPSRLKIFTGSTSSYEEGIDFVAKVVKLLVASVGINDDGTRTGQSNPPKQLQQQEPNALPIVSDGTKDLLRFLSFATPYYNPINIGSWTFTLGAFLHYFAYELCCRVGSAAGMRALRQSDPEVADAMDAAQPGASREIPPHEVVALMDALLPLCQQAIYSKNPHVGRAGEAALLYLVQIDPTRATPSFVDFATRALDETSVTMAHLAPSALSALTRLVQPALRADPSILFQRLPAILNLSLKGIDSNDQNKTIRTLILYRSLTSWLPIGGTPDTWGNAHQDPANSDQSGFPGQAGEEDGTMRIGSGLLDTIVSMRNCKEYNEAVERLPATSLMKLGAPDVGLESSDSDMDRLYLEEGASALADWSIEFLERVFGLLRASGEREKAAKTASGAATRHSNADLHQARNFSRVLQECVLQLFASMDDSAHAIAVRSIVRFLEEETYPSAAKDASLLCQGAAAARSATSSPGLDLLVPVLTDDIAHHSVKTSTYRIRCLAGAVRYAGRAVVAHRSALSGAIDYALASEDRHLFKTGCKLLRHLLATLSESYPIALDSRPRVYRDASQNLVFGRSGQLHGDPILWHVPDESCVSLAADLLAQHVSSRLSALCSKDAASSVDHCQLLCSSDIPQLRRCLRVVRYSIRGGASLLLDEGLDPETDDFVPYEIASQRLLAPVSQEARHALQQLRGRMCTFLVALSSIVASDTLYPDGYDSIPESDPSRKVIPLISSDPKVCKETCDLALLLLTRRGASFRSQEARTIWKAQKQVAADFTLCAQVDRMTETLQSASRYGKLSDLLYKDGEDAGKSIPRRLLVARVQLFHASLQRNASFEVPRRLRRVEREAGRSRVICFSVKPSLHESVRYLDSLLREKNHLPLDVYEGIIDGLFALCCHSNTQVRGSAISVVDYAMTRFGWIVAPRVPRMLSGLSLSDGTMNGKFGVPSCSALVEKLNQQGKRKRLAEAIKGVCSVLSMTRAVRQMLGSWKMRHRFVETFCGTDHLVSLLPAEEMQKIIHYLQSVLSPFRSSFYVKPRTTATEKEYHVKSIVFVLDILSEKKSDLPGDDAEANESKRGAHWRKLLIASWFLLVFVDEGDMKSPLRSRIWATCFLVLETNFGQPLQRVALGLFGKLVCMLENDSDLSELQAKMGTETFCTALAKSLVYDHKEDTSVGGGHDAQWSSGVETILRDAGRLVAPRTLFPFQRTSQSLGAFKVPHSQFLEQLLVRLDDATALAASQCLLSFAKELASSPPSEDQRNQQITAAEILAGVCGSFVRSPRISPEVWSTLLLPFLDDGMSKTPFSLCGAYFDAIRYSLQFASPESFFPLTSWLADKIKSTLWQPNGDSNTSPDDADPMGPNGSSTQSTEAGFTAQSKWMYLFSAVLIEMDETESDDLYTKAARFVQNFSSANPIAKTDRMELSTIDGPDRSRDGSLESSWRLVIETLLPLLADALGHPFDSCRDHISRCLFRICYSHRKFSRVASAPSRSGSALDLETMLAREKVTDQSDPGWMIVSKLSSLLQDPSLSRKDRMNSLITARRFISHCVHLGEAKFEFSDYVIPLLPLAFGSLDVSSDDAHDAATSADGTPGSRSASPLPPSAGSDENLARRALEAEVIKGYRGMIAEMSVTAIISYGGDTADLDVSRVLDGVEQACRHEKWQVRHASINYLRCFQGAHKFLYGTDHATRTTGLVVELLSDDRREVSSAAMAALTGILAAAPANDVATMVQTYAKIAASKRLRRRGPKGKGAGSTGTSSSGDPTVVDEKERKRLRDQQVSVFFLCATVLACPYDTPEYVPVALQAISPHSFERTAPLAVRDTVKKCCAEYKRTHMSDNWEEHRRMFSTEQLEAFEDVVSTPHYYA